MNLTRFAALVFALAGLAPAGCGDSVEPVDNGTVRLMWEVGPSDCEEAEIRRVRARLKYKAGERVESFDCEAGSGSVSNLRPANYKITLRGMNDRGESTYGAGPTRVTIPGGETTRSPRMRLTALPSTVELEWRFGNGLVCGANGVGDVRVALYDEDDYRVLEQAFDCTNGRVELEKVPPGTYLLEVRAKGEGRRFAGANRIDVPRGTSTRAQVVLKEVGGGNGKGNR